MKRSKFTEEQIVAPRRTAAAQRDLRTQAETAFRSPLTARRPRPVSLRFGPLSGGAVPCKSPSGDVSVSPLGRSQRSSSSSDIT
jgi:hypothetical protein